MHIFQTRITPVVAWSVLLVVVSGTAYGLIGFALYKPEIWLIWLEMILVVALLGGLSAVVKTKPVQTFAGKYMKFHLTTRQGVLLIAAVNLVVAVALLAVYAFAKFDPYCDTPEAVFRLVTFPLFFIAGCAVGNITFWTGSAWASPVSYALLVLNAYVWGVVGVRLFGWLWIMPERTIPYDEADLKGRLRRTITLHAALLFPLLLYLRYVPIRFVDVLFSGLMRHVTADVDVPFPNGFADFLPMALQLLISNTQFLRGSRLWYAIPLWVALLWLDARAFRHLYVAHGLRAARRWSLAIVLLMVAVFVLSILAMWHAWYVVHWLWTEE